MSERIIQVRVPGPVGEDFEIFNVRYFISAKSKGRDSGVTIVTLTRGELYVYEDYDNFQMRLLEVLRCREC